MKEGVCYFECKKRKYNKKKLVSIACYIFLSLPRYTLLSNVRNRDSLRGLYWLVGGRLRH
jgi:hypothetical protein